MSETSGPWDGSSVGDAVTAPYDAPTEFAEYLKIIAGALTVETNQSGIFRQQPFNSLNAISGGAGNYTFDSGTAIVYGTIYTSTGSASINIPTPSVATRIDRVVLRKDWVAQTIRVTRIAGVEGGAAPALVQIAGTTWDMPLWQFSITTGGVITTTDERQVIMGAYPTRVIAKSTSAPSGVTSPYTVLFEQTLWESAASMHDTGVLKNRLNATIPGVYKAELVGSVVGATIDTVTVNVRVNGVTSKSFQKPVATAGASAGRSILDTTYYVRLAFGDYVDFTVSFNPTIAGTATFDTLQGSLELMGTP